jgi:hypothetical protein
MAGQTEELEAALDTCLEGMRRRGWSVETCLKKYPQRRRELEPRLRFVAALRQVRTQVQPSATFKRRTRARVIRRLKPRPSPGVWQWFSRRVSRYRLLPLAIALEVLALILLLPSGVAYADESVPGETLYPADRFFEQAQLAVASPVEAINLRLTFAAERIQEAEVLIGQGNTAGAGRALAQYDRLVVQIGGLVADGRVWPSEQLVMRLQSELSSNESRLNALLILAPDSAQTGIQQSIQLSQDQLELIGQTRPFGPSGPPERLPHKLPDKYRAMTGAVVVELNEKPTRTPHILTAEASRQSGVVARLEKDSFTKAGADNTSRP